MSPYVQDIQDRLDFIEFKQNILFHKLPNHKADVFTKINIEEFLQIRELTINFEKDIIRNKNKTKKDYEKELFEICPKIKPFPSSSKLVAKSIMNEENFKILFK